MTDKELPNRFATVKFNDILSRAPVDRQARLAVEQSGCASVDRDLTAAELKEIQKEVLARLKVVKDAMGLTKCQYHDFKKNYKKRAAKSLYTGPRDIALAQELYFLIDQNRVLFLRLNELAQIKKMRRGEPSSPAPRLNPLTPRTTLRVHLRNGLEVTEES